MARKIKKYKTGIFSQKQLLKQRITLSIFVVFSILMLTLIFKYDLPFIMVYALGSGLFVLILALSNDTVLLVNKFARDCDVDSLLKNIDKLLENERLNEESVNYLKILKATYLILVDPLLAKELSKEVYKPKISAYYVAYFDCMISLCFAFNEIEKAKEIIRYIKDRKSISKVFINMFEREVTICSGVHSIDNIEKKKNVKAAKFFRVANLYSIMTYYNVRKDTEKAKEYAKLYLEENVNFKTYNEQAKKILGILEENKEQAVPKTVMIYLEKDNQYLMLYRNKKEVDINKGKYIGVGGHVEENETPDDALVREVKEETGLDLVSFKKRGIVYFVLNGYVEEMHVYTSSDFKGEIIECNEGELSWVDKEKVPQLNLWEGDIYFLDKILKDEDYFQMKLIYENDVLIKKEDM